MSVQIRLHMTHRQYTDGKAAVEVEGSTVKECLENLVKAYPGIRNKIVDKNGMLSKHIEVYINSKSAFPDELSKPVRPGDSIRLLYLLAGG